jgi:hypothetical protein
LFKIPHKPPTSSLKVLHAPARRGGIRRAPQTKIYNLETRVASRKVSMGFLRERDFSRDQPCETRLLARLESRMVSREKFAEVVGTRRVSGERHVLYLTSNVRTEQVWSRMSRETGLARRDHGLAVSSRVSSRKVSQRDATLLETRE